MIKVSIVYDNPKQISLFKDISFKFKPLVEYFDTNTRNGKKEGYKLKYYWGAKKNPFCMVYKENTPIKTFYSEKDDEDNAIVQLINYLKNE